MRQEVIHRNITFVRLCLDFLQFVRSQRPITYFLGKPFKRSLKYVEMDITYRCNMKCKNCNRSCTQAPSHTDLSMEQLHSFMDESIERNIIWERIRLLGGEPTLHKNFFEILKCLMTYRTHFNPNLEIVVCTNGSGNHVNHVLSKIPGGIVIKNTYKSDRQRLFRPFNMAPGDSKFFAFSDFSCGCRIISDCGLGVTPNGYYVCAVSGGIDRIFNFGLGRKSIPDPEDTLEDQLRVFCPLCGHFGFRFPTQSIRQSKTWVSAYKTFHNTLL